VKEKRRGEGTNQSLQHIQSMHLQSQPAHTLHASNCHAEFTPCHRFVPFANERFYFHWRLAHSHGRVQIHITPSQFPATVARLLHLSELQAPQHSLSVSLIACLELQHQAQRSSRLSQAKPHCYQFFDVKYCPRFPVVQLHCK